MEESWALEGLGEEERETQKVCFCRRCLDWRRAPYLKRPFAFLLLAT